MPGRDKTGPMGAGPMSGRALGFCANSEGAGKSFSPGQGRGLGRRRGFGRGLGRRFAEQERSAHLEKD